MKLCSHCEQPISMCFWCKKDITENKDIICDSSGECLLRYLELGEKTLDRAQFWEKKGGDK